MYGIKLISTRENQSMCLKVKENNNNNEKKTEKQTKNTNIKFNNAGIWKRVLLGKVHSRKCLEIHPFSRNIQWTLATITFGILTSEKWELHIS